MLAEAPPDLLKWNDDPTLADAIRAAIVPTQVSRRSARAGGHMTLRVGPLASNVAFEAFARFGGKEHPIGTVVLPAGSTTDMGMNAHDLPPFEGHRVDLTCAAAERSCGRRSTSTTPGAARS